MPNYNKSSISNVEKNIYIQGIFLYPFFSMFFLNNFKDILDFNS